MGLGLGVFAICLASTSILSITSITNAMSGHDAITKSMTPYFASFPFIVMLFCISFTFFIGQLSASPATRRIFIFLLVALAYLLSIITLHLSTFIINLKYT